MTLPALLLLALLALAFCSFFFDLLPVDVTALSLLFAMVVSGLVPIETAFGGFSNKGVLTIGGLFVLSFALTRTGVLEIVAERLSTRFGNRRWIAIAVLLGLVSLMSGFLNNTAVIAMTLPLAIGMCRRLRMSPSKVLIPLSFAAIFGGTLTLIGSSTNLLVSAVLEQSDRPALGMFEFTQLGAVFLVAGLGYVLFLAPRVLPDRAPAESLTRQFDMGSYLTELSVKPSSKLIGKTVRGLKLSERYDVTVLAIVRDGVRIAENLRAVEFESGDVLVARGATPSLLRLRNEMGVALLSDAKLTDAELAGGEQVVVEALITAGSSLIDRTLDEVDFRRSYGAFVLAIRRQEDTLRERLAHTPLQFADTLLIVVTRDRLDDLMSHDELLVVTELDLRLRRGRLWWLPILLIPLVMLLAATGTLDLLTGVLGAVVLLLALGVIRPEESYRAVDWRVVLFIAAFVPVGDAMIQTGLADLISRAALVPSSLFSPTMAPWVAVSVLYLVTALTTEAVTNNAAAIVLTPVALSMSTDLGVDHRPLVLAVCFAASTSFMTPTGYQTNMMVFGPGNYRFTDFTKFGAPLNLLFWVVATVLIPLIFPF